jgi:hypothetical protein
MCTKLNLANITISMCTFVEIFNAHFHDPLWVVQWILINIHWKNLYLFTHIFGRATCVKQIML